VHTHADRGRAAELEAELESELALLEARNGNGMTPLHFAASNGDLECVGLLLARGADRDAEDDNCWTALHFAAWNGYLEAVRLLVGAGAGPYRRSKFGHTQLHNARQQGCNDLAPTASACAASRTIGARTARS